jgi:hypothetical protein
LVRDANELEGLARFVGVVSGPDDRVDEGAVRDRVEEYEMPYPQVRDRDLSLSRRFGVDSTPTLIVLGEGGRVIYRGKGAPAAWADVIDQ